MNQYVRHTYWLLDEKDDRNKEQRIKIAQSWIQIQSETGQPAHCSYKINKPIRILQ